MRLQFSLVFVVLLFIHTCITLSVYGEGDHSPNTPNATSPLCFIENKGQVRDQHGNERADIDFKIGSNGINVFIGEGQIHYQWVEPDETLKTTRSASINNPLLSNEPLSLKMYRMDVELLGANKKASLTKHKKSNYYERYYQPQYGANGMTVLSYEKLIYENIYPNIDWVLYVSDGHIKYDFVIHPGGKVSDIRLKYSGANTLIHNEDGSITATTPMGFINENTPVSFQQDGSPVTSRFVLNNDVVSFSVDEYKGVLTIDPTLVWGTYYAGFGAGFLDNAYDVEYDRINKNGVYLSGNTQSTTNVATIGAHQVNGGGNNLDAFLVRFNDLGVRQWGTYYGGPKADGQGGARIACDSLGNIYMASSTGSTSGIATPGSHQDTKAAAYSDNFLVKFDSTGRRIWATYYGGDDGMEGIPYLATDGLNIYMASSTSSTIGIATPGSHQDILTGGEDMFLVKFDSAGIRQWATYYGGNKQEVSTGGIICDKFGFIYFTASTYSESGIATNGSHQVTKDGLSDGFIVKFDSKGVLQWATYYGGAMNDYCESITCDDSGNIYVAGTTESDSGIATGASHQSTLGGKTDVFLVKFDSSGIRQWGTYYGGPEKETFPEVYYDSEKLYLGSTSLSSIAIATPGAYQSINNALGNVYGNVFLAELNSNSGMRNWGTYYGGTAGEFVNGISYDDDGHVYICGGTQSWSGITTHGSHEDTFKAPFMTSYLAKFCVTAVIPKDEITGRDTICANSSATYSIRVIDDVTAYIWTLPLGWSGGSDSNSIQITCGTTGGILGIQVVRCNDTSEMKTYDVYVVSPAPAVITVNGFTLGVADTSYSSYQWLLNDSIIPGATDKLYTVVSNGNYKVITIDRFGCIDTSDVYRVTNYTGVEDITSLEQQIKVYPNPVSNILRISSPINVFVSIYSIEGKLIKAVENVEEISLEDVADGIYFLKISDQHNNLLKTEKIIKQL